MILSLIVLALLLVFYHRSPSRCVLLVVSVFPSLLLLGIGSLTVLSILGYVALLAFLIKNRWNWQLDRFPFMLSFIFCIFSYFLSYYKGGYERHPSTLLISLSNYVWVYLLWQMYRPSVRNRTFLIKCLTGYLLLLSAYGTVEAFTGINPIVDFLERHGMIVALQGSDYVRFGLYRAQSLTVWCSIFGTACGLGLVFLLLQSFKGYFHLSAKYYILFGLLLFGVIASGTRTVIAMTLIASCSLMPYMRRNVKFILPLCAIIVLFSVFGHGVMGSVVDSFLNHEQTEGSSVEGREMQYAAALWFYQVSPLYGNGLGFINEAIQLDGELLGGESIVFSVLVDRGMIGAWSLILLLVQVLYVLIKRKMYFLCFLPLSFAFAKIMSLLPDLSETFIILYLIPFIKQQELEYEDSHHYLPARV